MHKSLAVAGILLLGACGPKVSVTHAWKDPDYKPYPIRSVMVLGVAHNRGTRGAYETLLADAFAKRGVSALRSIDVMPPLVEVDEENVREAIEGRNVDVIFATRVLDVETAHDYVPPSTIVTGNYYNTWNSPGYYDNFWGYAPYAWGTVTTPGYYVDSKTYLIESTVWDAKSGEMIWTAQTSIVDPNNVMPALRNLRDKLVQELIAASLSVPSTEP
jgi:hypothetical protein